MDGHSCACYAPCDKDLETFDHIPCRTWYKNTLSLLLTGSISNSETHHFLMKHLWANVVKLVSKYHKLDAWKDVDLSHLLVISCCFTTVSSQPPSIHLDADDPPTVFSGFLSEDDSPSRAEGTLSTSTGTFRDLSQFSVRVRLWSLSLEGTSSQFPSSSYSGVPIFGHITGRDFDGNDNSMQSHSSPEQHSCTMQSGVLVNARLITPP